jgi:hypothetical protein
LASLSDLNDPYAAIELQSKQPIAKLGLSHPRGGAWDLCFGECHVPRRD